MPIIGGYCRICVIIPFQTPEIGILRSVGQFVRVVFDIYLNGTTV